MRKNNLLCAALSAALLLLTACGNPAAPDTVGNVPPPSTDGAANDAQTPTDTTLRHVEIEIKDYGTIAIALDPSAAPKTVENFIQLASDGFYDGLTFHRIVSDFVIQGGDPNGDGTGGSEQTVVGEFSANGVENPISHTRGAISMARSNDYDSGSSQFFIVHADAPMLDGQYAAFGHVTSGIEIVDKICETVQNSDSVPAQDQPVITTIKVID